MFCFLLKNTNPFFCLAAEEYLLKNFTGDIFMLWQSENTVVVGKHQNALAEVNYRYLREKHITLARRISGGGTVVHDMGNVNFTFIKNVNSPAEISFKQFTEPVREALQKLGIEATTSGRNDLLAEGFKISGNAEHVFKNRVLHHGTLLFNSDLKNLGQAIKVVEGKYESKAVQSNRSKVINISEFLKRKMSIEEFMKFLLDVQLQKKGNSAFEISVSEEETIQKLAREKFETWDWRWGYSPKYNFKNDIEMDGKRLSIHLSVKKGSIESCGISGNYFSAGETENLVLQLRGKRHCFDDVKNTLQTNSEELVYAFF